MELFKRWHHSACIGKVVADVFLFFLLSDGKQKQGILTESQSSVFDRSESFNRSMTGISESVTQGAGTEWTGTDGTSTGQE